MDRSVFGRFYPIAYVVAAGCDMVLKRVSTSKGEQWSRPALWMHVAMMVFLAFWVGERIRQKIDVLRRVLVLAWLVRIGESPF